MATLRNHFFHRPEECDSFQPCFFEHETDVEFYGTRAPMPSDEIWDKFELHVPTPPRSPNHEPFVDLSCSLLDSEAERLHLQPLLSEALIADFAEEFLPELPKTLPFPETPPTLTSTVGLNSKLIQDCMWSGRSVHFPAGDVCIEKQKRDKIGITGSDSCVSKKTGGSDSVSAGINISTECVDPAAVFPYPINGTRDSYLGIDTPSDSGNEEEEEIDVVNVEKIPITQLPTRRKATLVSPVSERVVKKSELQAASLLLPAVHACHTYSKQIPPGRDITSSRSGASSPVHGFLCKMKRTSGSISMPSSPQALRPTPSKRVKRHLTTPAELRKVAQKLKACGSGRSGRSYKTEYSSSSSNCSSRLGSDSENEGGGKRTQHNVLERKRRNDLKYSFFKLRDTVPELCQQERAPKVVILKKATDHINALTSRHNRIVSELEKQQLRNEQLRDRLLRLQSS